MRIIEGKRRASESSPIGRTVILLAFNSDVGTVVR